MSSEKERVSPDEARKLLDAIKEMKQIGSNRSVYPMWFHISLSVLIFLYFATIQENGPNLFPYFFVGIVLYGVMLRKVGVIPDYSKPAIWALFWKGITLAVLYLFVVYLRRAYNLIWAPYAGGLLAVSIYYLMYALRTRTGTVQEIKEEKL